MQRGGVAELGQLVRHRLDDLGIDRGGRGVVEIGHCRLGGVIHRLPSVVPGQS